MTSLSILRMPAALCVLTLLLAGVPLARAQSPEAEAAPEDEGDDEPRAMYAAGAEAFSAGDFTTALDLFTRLYDQSRMPLLLFNIGSCNDRLGDARAAVRHYRAYLSAVPDAENRGYVESRIVLLTEAEEADAESNAESNETLVERDPPTLREPASVVEPPVERPSRAGPVVLLVAGGGAAIGAVVSGVLALSSRSDLDEMCNELVCPRDAQDTHDAMKRRALATDLLGGAAMALVGAGVLWWILQPDGSPDEPQLSCGLTGCAARLTF